MLPLLPLLLPCLQTPGPQEVRGELFGHSRHGDAFDEGPRQAARLMEGMSPEVHFPIEGLSDEAQAFFDQGLTQLHGFWYFEAERSFRQVARLHPDCAMAYWGMALANREQLERAVGFTAAAVARALEQPRREELWIDAWAARYRVDAALREELRSGEEERVRAAVRELVARNKGKSKEEEQEVLRQLLKDLGRIVHEFPDDIEAKALLAVEIWHASDWGSGIEIVSHTAVDALLDQVFARAPGHPAHHYRIHLWDREAPERALASAAAIGASAPGIAHQWHMASHIYDRLHRHPESSWQQEASSRVDHAQMQRDRVMPFHIHNYGHNQQWWIRSLSHQGRVREALEIARNLIELPRHPEKNRVGKRRHIAGYGRQWLAFVCEEHELWETAVELAGAGYLDPCEEVEGELVRLGLVGRALYRLGRSEEAMAIEEEAQGLLPRARAERARAMDEAEDEALAAKLERERVDSALEEARREGTDLVRAVLDLQAELRAERLLHQGDAVGAVEILAGLDRLPRALLADAHLRAGDAAAAVSLLAAEVDLRPNRLATLGRLVLALREAALPEQEEELARREAALAVFTAAEGPLAERLGLPAPRRPSAADLPADFGPRPEEAHLGPRTWSPVPSPGFDLPVAGGGRITLRPGSGRPTLIVFYLGMGCLHCVEQLDLLAPRASDFAAAGIDLIAVGTDSLASLSSALAAPGAALRFPFPLLADPELGAFRAWRCHDDFEDTPLHGCFLLDAAGRVRWQDISFEPFTELDWLLAESRRLLALPSP